jgi:hypothetical protein
MMLHFTNASTAAPMSAGSERIGHLDFFCWWRARAGVSSPILRGPHEELRLKSRGQIDFYAKGFSAWTMNVDNLINSRPPCYRTLR